MEVVDYLLGKKAGGGGGGTSNYQDLSNKPSINGVTLTGNKTTSDLGIGAFEVVETANSLHVETKETGVYLIKNTSISFISVTYTADGKSIPIGPYSSCIVIINYGSTTGSKAITVLGAGIGGTYPVVVRAITNYSGYMTESVAETATKYTSRFASGTTTYLQGALTTDNQTPYMPTYDYHPVVKKYVDDLVGDINTILATLTTPSNGGGN